MRPDDVLLAVQDTAILIDLRASLAGARKRVLGIVDPSLPDSDASIPDNADATIMSAPAFMWLRQRRPKRAADLATNGLVLLIASVGELLDSLSLEQPPFGYLFSPGTVRHVGPVLDLAAEGQGYGIFPPYIAALLLNDGLRRYMVTELTSRERDVLRQLGAARSNREIAADLQMSEGYVKSIVRSILIKLRFKNRTAAAVFAARHGYAVEHQDHSAVPN